MTCLLRKPTNETFGLSSKLLALLRPSLLLSGETTDETGRCLHFVSAALGVILQCLMGKWADFTVSHSHCTAASKNLQSDKQSFELKKVYINICCRLLSLR